MQQIQQLVLNGNNLYVGRIHKWGISLCWYPFSLKEDSSNLSSPIMRTNQNWAIPTSWET